MPDARLTVAKRVHAIVGLEANVRPGPRRLAAPTHWVTPSYAACWRLTAMDNTVSIAFAQVSRGATC